MPEPAPVTTATLPRRSNCAAIGMCVLIVLVVFPLFQFLRQTDHIRPAFLIIVRVFVIFAIAKTLHQFGWRVTQMQRHRLALSRAGVFSRSFVGHADSVRFWG